MCHVLGLQAAISSGSSDVAVLQAFCNGGQYVAGTVYTQSVWNIFVSNLNRDLPASCSQDAMRRRTGPYHSSETLVYRRDGAERPAPAAAPCGALVLSDARNRAVGG